MTEELWGKAVDFFLSDAHEARSIANKAVRKQQKYVNRGDTSSYSSFCHKHNKKRLDAFYNAHTSKDGTFDSPLAEQQYDDLKAALESQTGVNDEGEYEESSASHPDEMEVFESVLGERRGHRRGIGPKSSSSDSMSFVGHHGQVQAPQSLTQDQIANLFQDPSFKDQLNQYLASNNYLKKNDKDHATDEDDE